jgi:hypothetical protein
VISERERETVGSWFGDMLVRLDVITWPDEWWSLHVMLILRLYPMSHLIQGKN